MAADSDGSVWYTASNPSTVGHVSVQGHITEYVVPTTAENISGIVLGPDGNVWFGEWDSGAPPFSRIGRMSRTGSNFQEFPVPESAHGVNYFAFPHVLVAGPDGNIWFTAGSDALARISLSGEVTKFYLPPDCGGFGLQQYGNPFGLTVGPDGALWIAGQTSGALYRFDLETEQTQVVPIAPCGSSVSATNVVTGPDGNLWVTDFGFSRLYRVSTFGQVTDFPMPGSPFELVAHEGSLFVTRFDHDTNAISRIDPSSGELLDDYVVPTKASGPENLAVDTAGNLWFNEQDGHNVGRLSRHPLPCIDALAVSYENHTLTVHFALKSLAAGIWGVWLVNQQRISPLWLAPIQSVPREVSFDVPLTGIPNVGPVRVITALVTATPAVCGDARTIDTGAPQ